MRKINNLELASIIIMQIVTIYSGINIYIIMKYTGTNAWITSILSYIFGIIPLLLMLYISNYKENLNIKEKINNLYKKIGPFINYFISIIYIIISATILYNINNFVTSQFLYRTPLIISSIFFIILAIYNANKGINTISRTSFILIFFNLFLFSISFISITKYIKIDNFMPILENGIKSPILTALKITVINYVPLLSILIIPKNKITNPQKYNKTIILSYLFACLISFLIVISTLGTLGIYLCQIYEYPEYIVLKKVSLFGFLERIENIVSNQWIIGAFVYTSLLLYYIKSSIVKEYKEKNKYITIIIGAIMLAISTYVFKNSTFFNNYSYYVFPYIVSLLLIVYIIIAIKIFIQKRKPI